MDRFDDADVCWELGEGRGNAEDEAATELDRELGRWVEVDGVGGGEFSDSRRREMSSLAVVTTSGG